MNYKEFSKEIHANAVEHGWWETERSFGEIIALCHSELSEALEEYRAGRPNAYVVRANRDEYDHIDYYNMFKHETDVSTWTDKEKPEGIAVELADVVIRCLDWFGRYNMDVTDLLDEAKGGERWMRDFPIYQVEGFGDLMAELHLALSLAYCCWCNAAGVRATALRMAVCCNLIFDWAKDNGVDMDELLTIKHRYNKTRPYKHGGKVI